MTDLPPQDETTAGNTSGDILPQDALSKTHAELLPVASPPALDAPPTTPAARAEPEEKKAETIKPSSSVTPSATPVHPVIPLSRLEDFLHGGNAVVFANEQSTKNEPTIDVDERKTTAYSSTPFERNVREIGLKERQSSQSASAFKKQIEASQETGNDGLPRIRTYAQDLSEEIRKRGTTLTSIVGAEEMRRTAEGGGHVDEDPKAAGRRKMRAIIFMVGAGALFFLGAGAIGIALWNGRPEATAPVRHTIIPVNRYEEVEHTGEEPLSKILADAKDSATLQLGEVEELVTHRNGQAQTPEELLTLLGAPSTLARNATSVMVGVHSFDHNQPFILIGVSAYDRAFEAMLSWETRMNEGLGDLFRPAALAPSSIASTPPPLTFTDRVFQNVDIRESQPAWRIIYAFARPDLIVITTNDATLREILTRLSLQKTQN